MGGGSQSRLYRVRQAGKTALIPRLCVMATMRYSVHVHAIRHAAQHKLDGVFCSGSVSEALTGC